MQAVYTAIDANELTTVTCAAGIDSVLVSNRTGATLLIQTIGAVQEAAPAANAEQLLQTASTRVYAADCNANPNGSWFFGLASAGSAVADLRARAL
jgi:hypothetical protein